MLEIDTLTVKEAIEKRRSIRKYKIDHVPEELIEKMLEAARLAPSGSNLQPWRFMVIRDPELRDYIAECCGRQKQIMQAPVIMVCCGDLSRMQEAHRNQRRQELSDAGVYEDIGSEAVEWIRSNNPQYGNLTGYIPYTRANVYIAVEHMVLRAVSLGLGTCWIGAFDHNRIHARLKLTDNLFIAALLPVGYPAQNPGPRPRLSMSEIILSPPEE